MRCLVGALIVPHHEYIVRTVSDLYSICHSYRESTRTISTGNDAV